VVSSDAALTELLRILQRREYRFTAVTPATHARVLTRPCEQPNPRDVFGWNRAFARDQLAPELLQCLEHAEMLDRRGEELRSKVRVASLGADLFLHSQFPTTASDAVFFGPDTYRFVKFVRERLKELAVAPAWIVDMGAGSGAGAIAALRSVPSARVTAIDINPAALRFTKINAQAAQVAVEPTKSSQIPAGPDLVIANPPYIMDERKRTYRDGGDLYGGQTALKWARQALGALAPGGTMLLYSGASVVDGCPPLVNGLQRACASAGAAVEIEEIDPDVFGEELAQPAYAEVERIAVIGAVISKR